MTGYTTNNRNGGWRLSWSEEPSLQEKLDKMYGISNRRASEGLLPQIQEPYGEPVAEVFFPDERMDNLRAQFQKSRMMDESRWLSMRFGDRTPEFDVLEITFSIGGGEVVREYGPRTYIQNRKDELGEKYKDKIHLTITQEIRCR